MILPAFLLLVLALKKALEPKVFLVLFLELVHRIVMTQRILQPPSAKLTQG